MAEKTRLAASRWMLYADAEDALGKLKKSLAVDDPPGPNQREVKQRRDKLAALCGEARETHIRYLALLKLDITSPDPENDFWRKLKAFEETIPEEVEDFTQSPPRADPGRVERELLEYQHHLAMQELGALVQSLRAGKDQLAAGSQSAVTSYISDCERGQAAASASIPALVSKIVPLHVEEDKRTALLNSSRTELGPHVKALADLRVAALQFLTRAAELPPSLSRSESLASMAGPDMGGRGTGQGGGNSLKVKSLDPPSWNGNVRTYHPFKDLFKEAIGKRCERFTQIQYMKLAIPKSIWAELDTHASEPQLIWDQLDQDYGSPTLQLRACTMELSEVAQRKLPDREKVVKVAATLIEVEAALTLAGMADHLKNDLFAAQIEMMLPTAELENYGERIAQGTITGNSSYARVKAYLVVRKKEIEQAKRLAGGKLAAGSNHLLGQFYLQPGGQPAEQQREPGPDPPPTPAPAPAPVSSYSTDTGCWNCGKAGHYKDRCPEPIVRCKDCKMEGHRAGSRLCTKGKSGGGRNRSRSPRRNRSRSPRRNNATQYSPADCWRCPKVRDDNKCGGCNKLGRQHGRRHCLLHCPEFLAAGREDRVRMAQAGNNCAACMGLGHDSGKCQNKQKDTCGVDSCTGRHHPTLHGSKDKFVLDCKATSAVRRTLATALGPGRRLAGYHTNFRAGAELQAERDKQILELKAFVEGPEPEPATVLMAMLSVCIMYGPRTDTAFITVFTDTGSSCCIILIEVAEQYGLFGRSIHISLETVNGVKDLHTKLYVVEILDVEGRRQLVEAIGMESITRDLTAVNFNGVRSEFSREVRDRWSEVEARPTGKVAMLMGADQLALFGNTIETSENLVVAKSPLSHHLFAYGSHSRLDIEPAEFHADVDAIRRLTFQHIMAGKAKVGMTAPYRVVGPADTRPRTCAALLPRRGSGPPVCTTPPAPPPTGLAEGGPRLTLTYATGNQPRQDQPSVVDQLMAAEDLGVKTNPRCSDCRNCSRCPARGRLYSQEEEEMIARIEEGITYDETKQRFLVSYPFTRDPACLDNNYAQVVRIAEKQEQKLARLGLVEEANKIFAKMETLGAVRKLSEGERRAWRGPTHYVSWQCVEAPDNPTTPLRFVTNSSLRSRSGISLNDILHPGPVMINDAFKVLVLFRNHFRAMAGDISKAFWKISCNLVESHVRRIVWRWGDQEAEFTTYIFLVISMGDRCSSILLELVVRLCCKMFGSIDPPAALKIAEQRFVDDIVSGGGEEEVQRMMGELDGEGMHTGTVPQILGKAGLALKCLVCTGEKDGDRLALLGNSLMGLGLSTEADQMWVYIDVNVSSRKRGQPTGPALTPANAASILANTTLTRRLCLSVGAALYDPLGIITPITIRFRCAMRHLFLPVHNLGWDSPLPQALQEEWRGLIAMVAGVAKVTFPRGTRPPGLLKLTLVGYWDASDGAYCGVVYFVWEEEAGTHQVRLGCSKARVNALFDLNTTRGELNGAVLLSRLLLKVVLALTEEQVQPSSVLALGDSEIVLSALEKDLPMFQEYWSNRVGEVRQNFAQIAEHTVVQPLGHVSSRDNAADRGSRLDSSMRDVGLGSAWQEGPAYLRSPRPHWPVNRRFAERKTKFPAKELVKQYREEHALPDPDPPAPTFHQFNHNLTGQLDQRVLQLLAGGHCTNSWRVLLRKTRRLLYWRHRDRVAADPSFSLHSVAEAFWFRAAMPATLEAWKAGKLDKLTVYKEEGMVRVRGRAGTALQYAYQVDSLPVLMATTRIGYMVLLHHHEQDHAGRDLTLSASLATAWVVGGRRLAGTIHSACVRCRFLERKLVGQSMRELPPALQVPSPVFWNCSLDYFGPFDLKTGRTTRSNSGTFKCWILLVACLSTKAMMAYACPGYSTEDLLLVLDSHISVRGCPRWIHHDAGAQIVRAAKEAGQAGEVPNWDMQEVARKAGDGQITWSMASAAAAWDNGFVERSGAKVKKTFRAVYGKERLNFLEFQCALSRISAILNSRPVYAELARGGQGEDPDFISAVTPNMLMLGRTSPYHPHRNWDAQADTRTRLGHVVELEKAWWRQAVSQNLASMVPVPKWRVDQRNVCVGDIVQLLYAGRLVAEYRLARVVVVEPDSDGVVRSVILRYSLVQGLDKAARAAYTGIKRKYIRTRVQRLSMLLPVEEQGDGAAVGQAEQEEARRAVGERPLVHQPGAGLLRPEELQDLPQPAQRRADQSSPPSPARAPPSPELPPPSPSTSPAPAPRAGPRTRSRVRAEAGINHTGGDWQARLKDCRVLESAVSRQAGGEYYNHAASMAVQISLLDGAVLTELYQPAP